MEKLLPNRPLAGCCGVGVGWHGPALICCRKDTPLLRPCQAAMDLPFGQRRLYQAGFGNRCPADNLRSAAVRSDPVSQFWHGSVAAAGVNGSDRRNSPI
ncbi:hypothetical protein [Azospirillum endophyticum]